MLVSTTDPSVEEDAHHFCKQMGCKVVAGHAPPSKVGMLQTQEPTLVSKGQYVVLTAHPSSQDRFPCTEHMKGKHHYLHQKQQSCRSPISSHQQECQEVESCLFLQGYLHAVLLVQLILPLVQDVMFPPTPCASAELCVQARVAWHAQRTS